MSDFRRSKPLQIYMKPGIKEDDILLDVWEACGRHDRPQDVFRTMLRRGLLAMIESGDMPEIVVEECNLDEHVDKKRRRRSRAKAPSIANQPVDQQGLQLVHHNQQIQPYPNVVAPAPHAPVENSYRPNQEAPNISPPMQVDDTENIQHPDEEKHLITRKQTVDESAIEKTKTETPARSNKEHPKSKRTIGKLM